MLDNFLATINAVTKNMGLKRRRSSAIVQVHCAPLQYDIVDESSVDDEVRKRVKIQQPDRVKHEDTIGSDHNSAQIVIEEIGLLGIWPNLKKLGVDTLKDLSYVEDADLVAFGCTAIERRRFRQHVQCNARHGDAVGTKKTLPAIRKILQILQAIWKHKQFLRERSSVGSQQSCR